MGYIDDTLTHSPQTVMFSRPYVHPVVFAQPLSFDGGDTSVVRITDVQPDRFTLYVDEAPNKDGAHTAESVSWMVLEAGQWELADGTLLEVGLVDTAATVGFQISNVWEAVDFNLPFSSAPVVVSQVQTEHDDEWVKTRQQDASSTGFEMALEPADSQTTAHGGERVGWLAIEPGTGTWNGRKYEAAHTADAVTQAWYTINFGQSFSAAPRFVAGISTHDGGDGSHLRYQSLTSSGVQVKVEEDTTYDSETNHTNEVVDYLAVQGSGNLTAQVYVTGSADETKHYYAGGQRVALRENGTLYYLLTDHLGSTAVTAETDGTKHSELRYKAWGENRYVWGDTPSTFQYTGQRNDAIIGLLFYNARYYDASLGRFIQADTIIPDPANPQSLNRYSYVYNNPLKYVDPSGHRSCGPGANPLDETCDENMDDPGYGDDGPNAGDEPYVWPPQFKGYPHPGRSGCDALSGMSTQCGDLGVVEKTIIAGLVFGPIILPYLIEVAPSWVLAYQAAGGAGTAGSILTACGGDCSDEFRLVYQGVNDWLSSGGLRYVGTDPNGLNRVLHVLRHTANNLSRDFHGVFTVGRNRVLPLLDEAYAAIQTQAANVTQLGPRFAGDPRTAFLVDFGERIIGYEGGSVGAGPGSPTAVLQLVLENANQVITAFPVR